MLVKIQMYEEAARLRDRIKSINQIQKYQSVYIKDMRNIDIFAIKLNMEKVVYMENFIEMEVIMEINLFLHFMKIMQKKMKF